MIWACVLKCCQRGLAQADAAVVRWYYAIGQHLDARAGERSLEIAQEKFILKDSAGKHYCPDLPRLAEAFHSVGSTLGDAQLKGARDLAPITSPQAIRSECEQQAAKIQFAVLEWKRIRDGIGRGGAGKVLEPHRGLAFESDLASETKERRSRVEQAPDRRCGERPHALSNQFDRLANRGGNSNGGALRSGIP